MASLSTSTLAGTPLAQRQRTATPSSARGPSPRIVCRQASKNVQRGLNSEVRKAKKLLPYDQKLKDAAPEKARKMFNARNAGDARPTQKISSGVPGSQGIPGGAPVIVFLLAAITIIGYANLGLFTGGVTPN